MSFGRISSVDSYEEAKRYGRLEIIEAISWTGMLLSVSWFIAAIIDREGGGEERAHDPTLLIGAAMVAFAVVHANSRHDVERKRRLVSARGIAKTAILVLAWGAYWFRWFPSWTLEHWPARVLAFLGGAVIIATLAWTVLSD